MKEGFNHMGPSPANFGLAPVLSRLFTWCLSTGGLITRQHRPVFSSGSSLELQDVYLKYLNTVHVSPRRATRGWWTVETTSKKPRGKASPVCCKWWVQPSFEVAAGHFSNYAADWTLSVSDLRSVALRAAQSLAAPAVKSSAATRAG